MDAKESDKDAARRMAGKAIALEQQRDAAGGVIIDLRLELTDAREKIEQLEASGADTVTELNLTCSKLTAAKEEIENLTQARTTTQQRIVEMLEQHGQSMNNLQDQLTAANERVTVLKNDNEAYSNELTAANAKVEKLRDALIRAEDFLENRDEWPVEAQVKAKAKQAIADSEDR